MRGECTAILAEIFEQSCSYHHLTKTVVGVIVSAEDLEKL